MRCRRKWLDIASIRSTEEWSSNGYLRLLTLDHLCWIVCIGSSALNLTIAAISSAHPAHSSWYLLPLKISIRITKQCCSSHADHHNLSLHKSSQVRVFWRCSRLLMVIHHLPSIHLPSIHHLPMVDYHTLYLLTITNDNRILRPT